MNRRKIEALRALAERPGTPAEGIVAREMLAKAEAAAPGHTPGDFHSWITSRFSTPSRCPCGSTVINGCECSNMAGHSAMDAIKRERFPRGTRVFYNQWAYGTNDPGTVVGYGTDWNRIRIQFDRLKRPQSVTVYSQKGIHLSTEPINQETLDRIGLGWFTAAEKRAMEEDIRRRCSI
jgi:hypothetical protein